MDRNKNNNSKYSYMSTKLSILLFLTNIMVCNCVINQITFKNYIGKIRNSGLERKRCIESHEDSMYSALSLVDYKNSFDKTFNLLSYLGVDPYNSEKITIVIVNFKPDPSDGSEKSSLIAEIVWNIKECLTEKWQMTNRSSNNLQVKVFKGELEDLKNFVWIQDNIELLEGSQQEATKKIIETCYHVITKGVTNFIVEAFTNVTNNFINVTNNFINENYATKHKIPFTKNDILAYTKKLNRMIKASILEQNRLKAYLKDYATEHLEYSRESLCYRKIMNYYIKLDEDKNVETEAERRHDLKDFGTLDKTVFENLKNILVSEIAEMTFEKINNASYEDMQATITDFVSKFLDHVSTAKKTQNDYFDDGDVSTKLPDDFESRILDSFTEFFMNVNLSEMYEKIINIMHTMEMHPFKKYDLAHSFKIIINDTLNEYSLYKLNLLLHASPGVMQRDLSQTFYIDNREVIDIEGYQSKLADLVSSPDYLSRETRLFENIPRKITFIAKPKNESSYRLKTISKSSFLNSVESDEHTVCESWTKTALEKSQNLFDENLFSQNISLNSVETCYEENSKNLPHFNYCNHKDSMVCKCCRIAKIILHDTIKNIQKNILLCLKEEDEEIYEIIAETDDSEIGDILRKIFLSEYQKNDSGIYIFNTIAEYQLKVLQNFLSVFENMSGSENMLSAFKTFEVDPFITLHTDIGFKTRKCRNPGFFDLRRVIKANLSNCYKKSQFYSEELILPNSYPPAIFSNEMKSFDSTMQRLVSMTGLDIKDLKKIILEHVYEFDSRFNAENCTALLPKHLKPKVVFHSLTFDNNERVFCIIKEKYENQQYFSYIMRNIQVSSQIEPKLLNQFISDTGVHITSLLFTTMLKMNFNFEKSLKDQYKEVKKEFNTIFVRDLGLTLRKGFASRLNQLANPNSMHSEITKWIDEKSKILPSHLPHIFDVMDRKFWPKKVEHYEVVVIVPKSASCGVLGFVTCLNSLLKEVYN